MKSILLVFTLLLGQISISYAIPDPRDSMILESKVVAPGADAGLTSDTSAYTYLKVWITNKDSLTAMTLALQERSIAGGAYMTLAWPRSFNGAVSMLTGTLNGAKIFNGGRYHSNSPDSFLVAGVYDQLNPATIEPPNVVRKPFWEIKFDSAIVSPNVNGLVGFDTATVVQSTAFTNKVPADVPVNFVNSTVFVGGTPPLFFFTLISPPQAKPSVPKQPSFIWSSLKDSALVIVPALYKVFISIDPLFSLTDTSPALPETTWRKPDTLASGQRYFWKVMALTNNADSVFSETWFFTVGPNNPPGLFNLIYPENGSKLVFKTIIFDWSDALDFDPLDTVKYSIEISPDSSFDTGYSKPSLNASEFTLRDSVLVRGTTYFWRVKAFDTQGSSTFSNNIFHFDFLELGDTDGDTRLAPADFVLMSYILYSITPIFPSAVIDMNCDSRYTTADLVIALNTIFLNTPPVCNP